MAGSENNITSDLNKIYTEIAACALCSETDFCATECINRPIKATFRFSFNCNPSETKRTKKMERQNEIDAIVRSWCRQFDALVFVFIIDTASQIVYQNSTR